MNSTIIKTPFNSSLETGVRTLIVLIESHPNSLDLQRLVDFDYLVVHSSDVNGPESLHPPVPMRAGELLVRRSIIESGLMLMVSRGFVKRLVKNDGIEYLASDLAMPFIGSLSAPYIGKLQDRANWVISEFGELSNDTLQKITSNFFDKWASQFHHTQGSSVNNV